eukprot:1515912-Rhodomonas_salina.4
MVPCFARCLDEKDAAQSKCRKRTSPTSWGGPVESPSSASCLASARDCSASKRSSRSRLSGRFVSWVMLHVAADAGGRGCTLAPLVWIESGAWPCCVRAARRSEWTVTLRRWTTTDSSDRSRWELCSASQGRVGFREPPARILSVPGPDGCGQGEIGC